MEATRPLCDLDEKSRVMTADECWGARSADGRWRFERVDENGATEWLIYPIGPTVPAPSNEIGCVLSDETLDDCRYSVAAGHADWQLGRRLTEMRYRPGPDTTDDAPTSNWVPA